MSAMELISDYMRDPVSRHRLNDLTQKVFGFDFESWVTQGYFEGEYIPYSFLHEGKFVSNVSANRMRFFQNGQEKLYIQLGTVMTDEDFRKQGLAGELMEQVIKTYENACDGIYLFGDLSAAGFYERMGFKTENQYRYSVKADVLKMIRDRAASEIGFFSVFLPVEGREELLKPRYLDLVRNGALYSSFQQLNRFGLQLFYTADLDNVFYAEDLDCFIVLEEEEDVTVLQSVLCEKRYPLTEILKRIEPVKDKIRLGFTPCEEDQVLCFSELYDGAEDYRLFFRGEDLKSIEEEKLYFPELSHA